MAVLKVHNGTVWETAIGKVFDGTVWKEKMKFHNGVAFVKLFGPIVSMLTGGVSNISVDAECFTGVRFRSDGDEEHSIETSVFIFDSRGDWLDSGLNSEVWIERIINSGVLDWTDSGTGRLAMTSTRSFGLRTNSILVQTTNVTFNMWDAASGGNLLQTVTYDLTAQRVTL